jgi:hypothetical protein
MGFAPGAPTSVTASLPATYGNTTASVSWTAPVMVGSPALSDYVIQYSSNSGSTWTTFSDTVSTATSVTVTGLSNGTAYVFRVAAVNTIGTGAFSGNSNSVTPLFGKIATPVVSNIDETTSTIPLCYDNYASQSQDDGYVYNYYNYNVVPNDQSGSCHGWTGLGENVNRFTYVYLSKTGWANSDSIYLEETTNSAPPFFPFFPFFPSFVDPCAGSPAYGEFIGQNCAPGTFTLQDVCSDGCNGQYVCASYPDQAVCGWTPPNRTCNPGNVGFYGCTAPGQCVSPNASGGFC